MASSSDHLKMIQDFPVYPTLRQISLMADQCGVSDLITAKKLVHLALATFGAISLPVSVAERLPEPEDCLEIKSQLWTMRYCWLGKLMLHAEINRFAWQWRGIPMGNERGWEQWTHWLPASALVLPTCLSLPVKEVEK